MTYSKPEWQNPYSSLRSTHKIWKCFTERVKEYGFDVQVTYTFNITPLRGNSELKPNNEKTALETKGNNLSYFIGDTDQHEYLDMLVTKKRLLERDPLAWHARNYGTVAIMGQDFLDPDAENYIDAKSFYEDMAPTGIRNSMCIPIPGLNPWTPHGFGLHSSLRENDFLRHVDEHFSCIMFDCTSFSKFFDAAYRIEKSKTLGLTQRQLEVVNMICSGISNAEIAELLNVSEPTVSFHLNAVRDKLDIQTIREIPIAAARLGIIDIT